MLSDVDDVAGHYLHPIYVIRCRVVPHGLITKRMLARRKGDNVKEDDATDSGYD